ncbi:hypothetical protein HDV05_007280, partial [Chytridiales sp. JEL 0842]
MVNPARSNSIFGGPKMNPLPGIPSKTLYGMDKDRPGLDGDVIGGGFPHDQGLKMPIESIQAPPNWEDDEDITGISSREKTPASRRKKKMTGGLGNHPVIKGLIAAEASKGKKGSKSGPAAVGGSAEVKIEELDEEVLKKRLAALDKDLEEYKKKCAYYKSENEWYRTEIEVTERDGAEYIKYLQSKKSDKQASIDGLVSNRKQEIDHFVQRKKNKEKENNAKIEELKQILVELEIKLESKQQEIMDLSDVMSKRTRHDAEIQRITKEIEEADQEHARQVAELEQSLLDTSIQLQAEADAKIQEMRNAANEKAARYLADHTTALAAENVKLEKELRSCITETQALLERKDILERENLDLERRQQVREDLVKLRVSRISEAQEQIKKARKVKMAAAAIRNVKQVDQGIKQRKILDADGTITAAMAGTNQIVAIASAVETASPARKKKAKSQEAFTNRLASRAGHGGSHTKKEAVLQKLIVMAGSGAAGQGGVGLTAE